MRTVIAAIFAALSASSAMAQDAVRIAFTPPVPSVFTVEEDRSLTFVEDGVRNTSAVRVRYRLEFRERGEAFAAVWMVEQAQWNGPVMEFAPDPSRWIGVPITIILGESGEPMTIVDWEDVARPANDGDDGALTTMEGMPAQRAATFLAAPLTMLEPCHNTHLAVGEPQRAERDVPAQRRLVRTSKELDSIDHSAGTAHIAFERVDRFRGFDEGLDRVTTVRADCTVSLASGVTQNAVTSTVSGDEAASVEMRSVISMAQR